MTASRQRPRHADVDAAKEVGVAACDESWKALRDECPVAWFEEFGGFWTVAKYADGVRVLQDHVTFSAARHHPGVLSTAIPPTPAPWPLIPEELDPPDSIAYKRLLAGLLSPGAVEKMHPIIANWVSFYIDQFIEAYLMMADEPA